MHKDRREIPPVLFMPPLIYHFLTTYHYLEEQYPVSLIWRLYALYYEKYSDYGWSFEEAIGEKPRQI